MRTLEDHKVNPANDTLIIAVVDEPGHGGANHQYVIESGDFPNMLRIEFQNGPINEVGVNGVTHEALLSILCDRMRGFQAGPYACADNGEALEHMEKAQIALQRRTRERMARGAEGTHTI